jgi:hypothetical protein
MRISLVLCRSPNIGVYDGGALFGGAYLHPHRVAGMVVRCNVDYESFPFSGIFAEARGKCLTNLCFRPYSGRW